MYLKKYFFISLRMNWDNQRFPPGQVFSYTDFMSNDVCDKIINFIDGQIKSQTTITEHWNNGNVQGDMFNLDLTKKDHQNIDNDIYKVIHKLIEILTTEFGLKITGDSGYKLRRISGQTRIHTDGLICNGMVDENGKVDKNMIRNMTVILQLNDDYDGGDFCFPEQNIRVKLKKGQIIAFPPLWTHPHYTKELENNTSRYSMITWLYGWI
jgi:predicted 2-oxoglutarate/Fe(II)-dependent dioxygenase YbiX